MYIQTVIQECKRVCEDLQELHDVKCFSDFAEQTEELSKAWLQGTLASNSKEFDKLLLSYQKVELYAALHGYDTYSKRLELRVEAMIDLKHVEDLETMRALTDKILNPSIEV